MRKRYFDQKKEHLFTQSTYGENNTVSKISLAAASPQTKVNLAPSPGLQADSLRMFCMAEHQTRQKKQCTLFAHQHHLVDDILFFFWSYLHAYMFSAGEIKDNEIQTRALF